MRKSSQNSLLVSVVMITYMHEAFIAEAIDGVLMQECDFEVELIIADDCSPDATSQIVENYIGAHPNGHWIKYMRHERNIGMMPNFIWALEKAKGKYVVLCDGDDYWLVKDKLKTQIRFLELNNDHSAIASHVLHVDSNKIPLADEWPNILDQTSINFRIIGWEYPVATCTLVFRNGLRLNLLKNIQKVPGVFGDYPLITELLIQGKIALLPQKTAAYRHHDYSNFSSTSLSDKMKRGQLTRKIISLDLFVRFKWLSWAIFIKNTVRFNRKYSV